MPTPRRRSTDTTRTVDMIKQFGPMGALVLVLITGIEPRLDRIAESVASQTEALHKCLSPQKSAQPVWTLQAPLQWFATLRAYLYPETAARDSSDSGPQIKSKP